ncbi:MAG: asparagine synthetase B, partial [Rhodospirillales bacterium]
VTANDTLAVVPDLANIYDEPFADSSQIPTLLLSRFARKSVKVVLSGDGGDELFAGYNRHLLAASYLPRLEQQPLWLRRLGANVLNNLPPAFLDRLGSLAGIRQAGEKSRKLSAILPLAEDFGATYDCLTCQGLGSGETLLADPDDSFYRAADPSSPDFDFLDQMLLRDTKTYLPGDILVKLDRASMSVGLEARVPLLDHRLYELAWTLPNSLKAAGGAGKIALRRILGRHLPSSLFDGKPKMGFAVPLDTWLTGPLRTWAEDLLAPESLKRNGFLDAKRCLQMWQDHKSGRCKRHHTLWNLLMLLSWLVGRRGA